MKTTHILTLPVLAALAPLARPQGVVYSWPGQSSLASAAPAGDVDGDGLGDFAIGEPPGPLGERGRLVVRSGADGAVVLEVVTDGTGLFGRAVAGLGDVDGDGHADVAVAEPTNAPGFGDRPRVVLVSGADGEILWERGAASDQPWFGTTLEPLPDLDGDGVSDLAIGAPYPDDATSPGAVGVHSGASGALLFRVPAPAGATAAFGHALAAVGDLDQDGLADLAVGDPAALDTGRVTVHSGADGALLAGFDGVAVWSSFGWSVDSPGDIDGDGVPELLISAIGESDTPMATSGRVRLYSGASGAVLLTLQGSSVFGFGEAVAAFDDLDGDGLRDLAVAAGNYHVGCCLFPDAELRVFSSASGALLQSGGSQSDPGFAVVPDVNGDGLDDYLLPKGFGTKLALTGLAPPVVDPSCPAQLNSSGCYAIVGAYGAPSATMGDALVVTGQYLLPATPTVIAWSTQPASIPFGAGTLCLAAPIRRGPVLMSSSSPSSCPNSDTQGIVQWRFPDSELLALGLTPGDPFYVQIWYRDPGFPPPNDTGLTGAVVITLWP